MTPMHLRNAPRWQTPLLLLLMFVKYSGGPSYEKRLTYQRPGYAEYIARTSSLIPWPPKKAGAA